MIGESRPKIERRRKLPAEKTDKRYTSIHAPWCSRADAKGRVREHVAIAERAFGRDLDPQFIVHHLDGDRRNNTPSNLVICGDQAYHMLLHRRLRILRAGGDPNTQRICNYCARLLMLTDFGKRSDGPDGISPKCKACVRDDNRNRRSVGVAA